MPVTVVPPAESSLSLAKRAETQGPFEVGDQVTYVYTVTNTNTGTTTLTDITVADDLVSQVTCDETTLAPGPRHHHRDHEGQAHPAVQGVRRVP
ncbi:DUF7507 domain-containing protein [Streptomyces laurentii]|uniref:DUF7507 domain-containing protein n=1 Tax=Streptomyces laurentii TaxID=39478 RepID=UPI0033FB68CB